MSFKSKVASFFRIFGVCLLTISIPAMLILYGLQAKKYKDLTKEVVELERKQEKLIEENKRIVSEISVLTNAERIEKIAVEDLGKQLCRYGKGTE